MIPSNVTDFFRNHPKRHGDYKMTRTITLAAIALGLAVILQVGSALAQVDSPSANKSLPMHVWWTRASLATGLLDRAQEFNVNAIILENDLGHVGWNRVMHGLSLYDFSERCRVQGEGRNVES